jgi:hypothetical protein
MKSLLIVELNSTKVRFLKVNNPNLFPSVIARKSFKYNKNITKNINYSEIQKINEYINNALNNRFKSFNCKQIHILDTVSPLYLNRIKSYFNGKSSSLYAESLTVKKMGYFLRFSLEKTEISIFLYNERFYIAYMLNNRFIFKVFLHESEIKEFIDLKTAFLNRLIMFDLPINTQKINIVIDEDFYFKSYSFDFLRKYFKKALIEYKVLNFIGFCKKKWA